MTRLIDADALSAEMYHKSFEVDDGRSVWNSGLWIRYKIFEEAIREAPTVDAIPAEWIPVSEQMPEEFKTVLVFALSDDGDHGFMTTASHEGRGIWYDECFYQPLPKVYAWMPLPEPYLVKF